VPIRDLRLRSLSAPAGNSREVNSRWRNHDFLARSRTRAPNICNCAISPPHPKAGHYLPFRPFRLGPRRHSCMFHQRRPDSKATTWLGATAQSNDYGRAPLHKPAAAFVRTGEFSGDAHEPASATHLAKPPRRSRRNHVAPGDESEKALRNLPPPNRRPRPLRRPPRTSGRPTRTNVYPRLADKLGIPVQQQ